MRVHVEAYGCTLNFGEAGEVEELLRSRGWTLCDAAEDADLVVLFTCVVIDKTERAMMKRLRELSGSPRLIVTGCMATACAERAREIIPDAVLVPPGDIGALAEHVEVAGPGVPEPPLTDSACAIVPLASGCTGSCAYCITRLARGHLRSRSAEEIVGRVAAAVSTGPKEIQLTAQDTASYGSDIGLDLPRMVAEVCLVPGEFRVRVGMMNPATAYPLADEIARMYEGSKVFKFLHVPVQSGSDRILAEMARGYSVEQFRSLVDSVKGRVPEVTLSTDLIVGYPGETEEDHEMSLDLMREIRPDVVNVTRFSPRPGTEASAAKDVVPGLVAKQRSRELAKLRFDVSSERNRLWMGRHVSALATERGKGKSTILRTDEYKQVVVLDSLELGRFYGIRIEGHTPTYLIGSVLG